MSPPVTWSAVVPVKRTSIAKTRLTGSQAHRRPDLAMAFATDTVSALLSCRSVADVVVVTDDDHARQVLSSLGATVVSDEPDSGLNPALVHGSAVARDRRQGCPVLLVSADLPALRAAELERVLEAAGRVEAAFVCDAAGTGTTVLTMGPRSRVQPMFGPRSRAAHRRAGYVELILPNIASVRRDVDTSVDLWDAARLGLGEATRAVLDAQQPS